MKTSELTGYMLDYWVLRTINFSKPRTRADAIVFNPSTDWRDGGPIIERERILVWPYTIPDYGNPVSGWFARANKLPVIQMYAETPLVAAMRAYVASRFGDEVPDEVKSS